MYQKNQLPSVSRGQRPLGSRNGWRRPARGTLAARSSSGVLPSWSLWCSRELRSKV